MGITKIKRPVLSVRSLWVAGLLLAFGLLTLVNMVLPAKSANATTSSTINFQARLLTATGGVVADGNYNVEFKLYNASTSSGSSQGSCTGDANCLWTETRTSTDHVRVVNGYLTVNLGSVTSFPTTINWDQQLWLTMNIGGTAVSPTWDGEMSPRLQLTAVPYAFRAGTLVATNGSNVATVGFVQPTANRSILVPDESGTICLQNSANCGFLTGSAASGSYVQLQGTTPGTAQTGNFNITGTGIASILQAGTFDTATGATLNLGTTNATSINIGKAAINTINNGKFLSGDSVYVGTTTVPTGVTNGRLTVISGNATTITSVLRMAASQSVDAIQVQDSTGACVWRVSQIGTSGSCDSSTAATGSTTFRSGDTSAASSNSGSTTVSTGGSTTSGNTGTLNLNTGNAASGNSGNISIDVGTASGTTGTIALGATSASQINIGRTSGSNTPIALNGQITAKPVSDTASALSIQNASSEKLVGLDTTANSVNLVTNGSFETNTTGYAARTGCTLSRASAIGLFGAASGQCVNTATAGAGVNYNLTLTAGQQYTVSFYAKIASSTMSTLDFGYAYNGSDETTLISSANTAQSSGWTRMTYTFTPSSISGTPYIFIKQSDATARTINIDGVQVEQNSTASAYGDGKLTLNSTVTSSLILQPANDSNTGFAVYTSTGLQAFNVNTLTNRVGIGIMNAGARLHVQGNTANLPVLAVRGATSQSASLLQVEDNNGNVLSSFNSSGQLVAGRTGASGLQGSILFADGTSSNTATIQLAGTLSGSVIYQLPVAAAGTYSICTTASVCTGYASSSGYIQLQGSSPGTPQTGNFNISGTGIAGTLQAGTFDTPSGTTTLAVGTTNATAINLNQNVTVASGKSVTIQGNTTQSNGTFSFTGNAGSSLTTSAGALTVTSAASASWTVGGTNQNLTVTTSGTGTLLLDTTGAGTTTLGNTASIVNVGAASSAHTIHIGDGGTNIQAVTVGSTSSTSSTTIQGGTGTSVSIQTAATGTIAIATANAANTVQIGNTANGIAQTINIGNNATASSTATIAIGDLLGTSATTIQGGTGTSAVGIQAGSGGTISIGTSNPNIITIGNTSSTNAITLGQSTASNTINVGTGTTATGNTQTINVGTAATGTGKATINIGNTNAASAVNILVGTGNANIQANNSQITSPILSIQNAGTGDAGIQFATATANTQFYAGVDASNSNTFTVNSYLAATTTGAAVSFGDDFTGGGTDNNGGVIQTSAFTATATGTLTSITVDFNSTGSPANTFSVAVYADNGGGSGGAPTGPALGSSGFTQTVVATAGLHNSNTITGLSVPVVNGTRYWLAFNTSGNAIFWYHTGLASTQICDYTTQAYGSWPSLTSATFTPHTASCNFDVKASIVPGGSLSDTNTNALFTITQSGAVVFRNSTDSTGAFSIQNASSVSQLAVDASNSRIILGTSGGDATGTTLVLGNKTGSGDPSGVTGAMYYSQNSASFRCYEGYNAWTDCLGIPKPNTRRTSYVVYNGQQSTSIVGTQPASGAVNNGNNCTAVPCSFLSWFSGYGDSPTITSSTTGNGASAPASGLPAMYIMTSGTNLNNFAGLYGTVGYYGASDPSAQTFTSISQDGNAGVLSNTMEWVGLTDATGTTMAGSATPTGNYAMFRYRNGTDTKFQCVTSTGSSHTIVDSGVTVTTGGFKLEVDILSGTKAVFKINGSEVCNSSGAGSGITTNLPSTTTTLNFMDQVSTITTTHRAYISVAWEYVESDY